MDELYSGRDSWSFDKGAGVEEAVGTAASVFKNLLEEMGIDPLDRSDWLGRFIESHRSQLAQSRGIGQS